VPSVSDEEEEENLSNEVDEILEAVFNEEADTLWRKVFNAIKKGYIDIPFSPHIINANEVITIRDPDSNIRFLKRGKVPISDKSFAFEQSKIHLREGERVVDKIIRDIGIML
jgi:methylaspartate mutase epsilon subunit